MIFKTLAYIILFTCVLYRLIQFSQQRAQTTTFSWFYFWAKWIIFQYLVYFSDGKNKPIKRTKQFISPIKNPRANVLFNVLSMFQISKSWFFCLWFTVKNIVISPNFLLWKYCGKAQFLHSWKWVKLGETTIVSALILFSKKLFQKIFYIALTNTCVNKDFWKNRVTFEVSLKVKRWAHKFPWMKRSQIFFF